MNIIAAHGNSGSPFDGIRHMNEHGQEYWKARELMPLLGYTNWRQYYEAIQRAIAFCAVHGELVANHFEVVLNLVKRSQGEGSQQEDYKLSRYGAYLIAMNDDPRKPEVASAQAYFAIKTREAETVIPAQSDRIRELELQLKIVEHHADLSRTTLETRKLDSPMITLHGAPVVLALRGMADQVVDRTITITEVIDEKTGVTFKGATMKQLAEIVKEKYGIKFKSGAELQRFIENDMKRPDLIDSMKRPVLCGYVPEENIKQVVGLIRNNLNHR